MHTLANFFHTAKTICDIKRLHQTHGLLDRVCDLKIRSGFRASMTSNVFVTSTLRLTGSRRRPALSLIAQLTGKPTPPFIQDSIRASFVEGTLITGLEKVIKESLPDNSSGTHSSRKSIAPALLVAETLGVRVLFIHISRAVTMTSYVFVISPLRSGARTESFDSKLTSLHLFVDAARLWRFSFGESPSAGFSVFDLQPGDVKQCLK